jgi:peptidoglycan/LPS O-acetylase OafA/YrhL
LRRLGNRLYEIDLLRIIAALSVVLYHYSFSGYLGGHSPVEYPALSPVTRYGYLGVDMFFVISGFVVLLSAWGRRPSDFVISRIVRLYPAFWVAVTITAIVSITLSHGHFRVSAGQYLANLTMFNSLPNITNVDVVYWTLWSELRFYALVFIMAAIGITRTRMLTLLWLWLGATFVLQTGKVPGTGTLDLVVQSQFSHYFIAGMALCLVYRFGWSWHIGVILALAFGNAIHRGIGFAHDVGDRYHTELNTAVVVVVIAVIFCVLTTVALRVTSGLARPWFTSVGALTYPLYLVHAHIGFVLFERLSPAIDKAVLLPAVVAWMCLLAYAIHAVVERPFAPILKRALVSARQTIGRRERTTPSQMMPRPPARNRGQE